LFEERKLPVQIKYTEFVADPALRGKTVHLPGHIAQVLVASGQATEVKRLPHGSGNAWLAQRAAECAAAGPPDPQDVDANVKGTQWGVLDRDTSVYGVVRVVKKQGCETTFYTTPPADAPPGVVARFKELTQRNDGAGVEQLARARKEQIENEERTRQQAVAKARALGW